MTLQMILSNFALILFVLMVVTGVIWCIDVFYLAPLRRKMADAALAEYDARAAKLMADGVKPDSNVHARAELERRHITQPTWIEYSGSFFPVIALVFFLRSFLFEPFKIPTTSMVPTLLVGDLILVNKFTYGVRLPILNKKIIDVNDPQRGDVMVFKFPKDMSQDYIKRVIGVPGDKIVYENKRLTVNGQALTYAQMDDYLGDEGILYSKQLLESSPERKHRILNNESSPSVNVLGVENFPQREACDFSQDRFSCIVPAGNYFMMGDNRDNSQDSRFWGFVPNKNIVGKAIIVWMNLGNPKRIGGID